MSVARVCDRCGKTVTKGETYYVLQATIHKCTEGGDSDDTEDYSIVGEDNEFCKTCRTQIMKAFSSTIRLGPDRKKSRGKAGRPRKKKGKKKKAGKKSSEKPKVKVNREDGENQEGAKKKKRPPPAPKIPRD